MRRSGALALTALVGACTAGEDLRVGSVHVVSQLVVAAAGAQLDVVAAAHEALAGSSIVISGGALADDTLVTIDAPGVNIVGPDSVPAGATVAFGPGGTLLSVDAFVTIPYRADFDVDLARVYLVRSDGTRAVLHGPTLDYREDTRTVAFRVSELATFQAGTYQTCEPAECGPELLLPNWICEDGGRGGPTGRCVREPNGICRWGAVFCKRTCDIHECPVPPPITLASRCADGSVPAPACRRDDVGACRWVDRPCAPQCAIAECRGRPGAGAGLCADGRRFGPLCERGGDGTCNWQFLTCEPDCRPDPNTPNQGGCCDEVLCEAGTRCEPVTAECVREGEVCGHVRCRPGQKCCSASCGLCVDVNAACPTVNCVRCDDEVCDPNEICDPRTNRCLGLCRGCAIPPRVIDVTCEDGSTFGPTGRCVLDQNGECRAELNECVAECPDGACIDGADPTRCPNGGRLVCRRQTNGACHRLCVLNAAGN